MPAIITDTFDYDDIVRVLDLDEAFVHHQIDALQPKYWRIVIKTKPKGLKIFAPVMVSGNRGIDYLIYMLSRDWQITKKQRLLDYMYFGVYRQTDGFHLVGFMYLDSNPLAKPEKAFFTPHFFDRYKERTGLPMDMPKMEVMKDWIMKNLHLNSDAQGNEKYPDGIFCAYPSGVALGRELPDGNSEMKTFVTYDMLRGEQIEKGENQSRAAKVQEEEGFRNYKELVDKLVKYGIPYKYPRPAVTADCIVITREAEPKVLLIQRGNPPFKGAWAFPGGFMDMDETTEQCAIRELEEETGLRLSDVHQIGAYSKVDRDPRGRTITVAYLAIIDEPIAVTGQDDAAKAEWWPLSDLPHLAFDHYDIMQDAVKVYNRHKE